MSFSESVLEMDDTEDLFGSDEEEEKKEKASGEDKKFLFRRELRAMLYGFGDEKMPFDKTLETLEAIVIDYIKELCVSALKVGDFRIYQVLANYFYARTRTYRERGTLYINLFRRKLIHKMMCAKSVLGYFNF